ncbi:DUF4198 domain-containing protein [Desulfuribacillus alkaliarsenatis]|uniref:Cobalt ABC transporter substrate-binding protein n=1 Tax=Desulfuribacillus alkaliarsenatis TaxID=766136 RepID=A0A1E5G3T2_9FIRM|nr:DUF4198 domain-containing protein [Desulfuribacillus alkaliarsenatis]OEF97742.1 hypothetical protein BHF68_13715 [Desulfuribacillus alkaliarsenatis]
MKKRFLAIILVVTLVLSMASMASAHELYFVDLEEGKMGEEIELKLWWGHFPHNPDPESAYFNSIPEGELYVHTPDGKEIALELTQQDDHYSASFIPETGGDFQVIFKHDRGIIDWAHGEPQGFQHIQTLVKAYIPVDGDPDLHAYDLPANLDLEIIPKVDIGHFQLADEFQAVLKYLGEPLANQSIIVVSPTATTSDAEIFADITTDENGVFSFVPNDENTWMLKVALFDDERGGVTDGQEYIGTRYTLTTYFLVQPQENEEVVVDTGVTPATPANDAAAATEQANTQGKMLLIGTIILFAGAAFLFLKGRKKGDVNA